MLLLLPLWDHILHWKLLHPLEAQAQAPKTQTWTNVSAVDKMDNRIDRTPQCMPVAAEADLIRSGVDLAGDYNRLQRDRQNLNTAAGQLRFAQDYNRAMVDAKNFGAQMGQKFGSF